jgi:hypothetical protein
MFTETQPVDAELLTRLPTDLHPFTEQDSAVLFVNAVHDALDRLIRPVRDEQFTLFVPRNYTYLINANANASHLVSLRWSAGRPLVYINRWRQPFLGVSDDCLGFRVETTTSLLVGRYTTVEDRCYLTPQALLHLAVERFLQDHELGFGTENKRLALRDMLVYVLKIAPNLNCKLDPVTHLLRQAVVHLEWGERSVHVVNRLDHGIGPVTEGKSVLEALLYKAGQPLREIPKLLHHREHLLSLFRPYGVTECVETS